jgi:hypothetical protein
LGGVESLTGVATVVAKVSRNGGTATTLTAAVTDETERQVTVQLGDVAGWLPTRTTLETYDLEIQATYVNGAVLTWPAGRKDRIVVWPQAAP